jgi:uncharacterized protein DUF5335
MCMSKAGTSTRKRETQEIERSHWSAFLAAFTQENRGAHARLEVLGPDAGYQVETGDRPFEGVAAEVGKRDESAVWINLGSVPADHLTHGIPNVTAIRALPAEGETGAVLEVESKDGTRAILELSRPDAYALPPAGKEKRTK